MKAIILAAGRGRRMMKLTDNEPKCKIKLFGKPLIEWQLKAIKKNDIKSIGIVTGYKRKELKEYKLKEFFNKQWSNSQMFASLRCANNWLSEDYCIVSYSDIFYDSEAIKLLMSSDSDIAITYDPNWISIWSKRFDDPLLDAETFLINSSSNLIEIGNKPTSLKEVQGQYMGLIRITPVGWKKMNSVVSDLSKNEQDNIHLTKVLQLIVQEKLFNIKVCECNNCECQVDRNI